MSKTLIKCLLTMVFFGINTFRAEASLPGSLAPIEWGSPLNSPSLADMAGGPFMDDMALEGDKPSVKEDKSSVTARAAAILDLHSTRERELETWRPYYQDQAARFTARLEAIEAESDQFGVEASTIEAVITEVDKILSSIAGFFGAFSEIDEELADLKFRAENYRWSLPQPIERTRSGDFARQDPDYQQPEGERDGFDPFEYLDDHIGEREGDQSGAAAASAASGYSCSYPRNLDHPVDCGGCLFEETLARVKEKKEENSRRTFKPDRKKTSGAGKSRLNKLLRKARNGSR